VSVDIKDVAAVVMGVMVGGDENEASASEFVGKGSLTIEVHNNGGEVAELDGETDGAAGEKKVEIDDVVSDETNGIEVDDIDDVEADDNDDVEVVDEMVGIITDEVDDIAAEEIDERS